MIFHTFLFHVPCRRNGGCQDLFIGRYPRQLLYFFEAANKTKCTRRAQFSKTGLHEDQAGFDRKIYPYHDPACQCLPVTSYKSSYLL